MDFEPDDIGPVVVERHATVRGELVLRYARDEGHYEIISNGVFLMDTRGGVSERLLVRSALDRVGRPDRLLLGGLGVGVLAGRVARPTGHGRVRGPRRMAAELSRPLRRDLRGHRQRSHLDGHGW